MPKTTVNTIIKRWEKEGLLTQTPIPGKRREMYIMLTDAGKDYAKKFMNFLYKAEDKALKKHWISTQSNLSRQSNISVIV